MLKIRITFTEDGASTLKNGAAELAATDMNEEGADSLVPTARRQLGIQALRLCRTIRTERSAAVPLNRRLDA